jgi:hypothetical protein
MTETVSPAIQKGWNVGITILRMGSEFSVQSLAFSLAFYLPNLWMFSSWAQLDPQITHITVPRPER